MRHRNLCVEEHQAVWFSRRPPQAAQSSPSILVQPVAAIRPSRCDRRYRFMNDLTTLWSMGMPISCSAMRLLVATGLQRFSLAIMRLPWLLSAANLRHSCAGLQRVDEREENIQGICEDNTLRIGNLYYHMPTTVFHTPVTAKWKKTSAQRNLRRWSR